MSGRKTKVKRGESDRGEGELFQLGVQKNPL